MALVLAFTFALAGGPLAARENPPELPLAQGGPELAAQLSSLRPDEASKWTGVLNIFGRGEKSASVPVSCETTLGETNWTVTYLTRATAAIPAEKLTIIFSTNAPNQYLYARAAAPGAALGEPKTLTGAEADIPLAGSDFWLSDLGFEFFHWPDQERLKGEMRRGRPCYVIESRDPHPPPGGYARVVTFVEKESTQPLEATAYGADKKTLKEFEMGSVEKVHGHYEVKNLKIFNRKTGSRTTLEFDLDGK